MHVDEPATKELLAALVRNIACRAALKDDLLQEALIHLWMIETNRPGQTRSWYLQSCKFHLLHYLASGRSIDSHKRYHGHTPYDLDSDGENQNIELMDSGDSVFSFVSARQLIGALSAHLQPVEKAVLEFLADGLGPREIGRRLRMSHTMVIKHRCKIASLFNRLEEKQVTKTVVPLNLPPSSEGRSVPRARAMRSLRAAA